jgi:hypothetical protein
MSRADRFRDGRLCVSLAFDHEGDHVIVLYVNDQGSHSPSVAPDILDKAWRVLTEIRPPLFEIPNELPEATEEVSGTIGFLLGQFGGNYKVEPPTWDSLMGWVVEIRKGGEHDG